jgi:hypothetical protein
MTSQRNTKLRLWISRIALVISVFTFLFVLPLCYCPSYYVALSVTGIVPILCGPRLYRWFGGAYIFAALLFAAGQHRAAIHQSEEIQRMRAQARIQHP